MFPQTKSSHFTRHHERFFFLYGKTDDEFCVMPLGILRLEEVLHQHLRELGYKRILFFNGKQKLCFYDHESGALTRGRSPGSETLNFGQADDLEMVGIMDHCMKENSIKTAVVFTDGLDFINHTDHVAVRQMAANLNQWSSLFSINENICVFLMPDLDTASISQLLERSPHWQFLLSKMFVRNDRPSGQMIYVGPPRKDEVENLFNYFRLKNSLKTDWLLFSQAIVSVTRNLCSEGERLKALSAQLKQAGDLGSETLSRFSHGTNEEPAMTRLKSMKGLEPVVRKTERFIILQKELESQNPEHGTWNHQVPGFRIPNRLLPHSPGSERKLNLHMVLTGNPGTGKTTAGNLLGEIFRDAGLLELGHVVRASREDLVAGYVGQTALRTSEKISEAMGGVLFVDEAYRLTKGDKNDFGLEALETIMEAMSNHIGEFSVVIAGYPRRIQAFLEANPGLKRRFSTHNMIHIPDYKPSVLWHIFEQEVRQNSRCMDKALSRALPVFFINWHAARYSETFGNAGDVKNLFQEMDARRAQRVMNSDQGFRKTFTLEDVPERLREYLVPANPEGL